MKKYLTPGEVCEMFQIKLSKLYRMSSQHRIPHLKIGNELRFDLEELKRFFGRKDYREVLA
ncbi:MAG: helix-turn-helix domain-containing protein [Candidatus Altiarchaeales archaeon]|nr:helix-turn-helix domain-containing protein [Candidatus Altiarchaeales archaeon]